MEFESSTSVLEEFLDSILYVPVEMKRYLSLIRELDYGCLKDSEQLRKLQDKYLTNLKSQLENKSAKKKTSNAASSANGPAAVEEDARALEEIAVVQKRLMQKIDEKRSIAEQLYDMAEDIVKRANADVSALESIFKISGVGTDSGGMGVGKLVAACTSTDGAQGSESLWILAKVIDYSSSSPERVVVQDVDTDGTKYTLQTKNVVVLPDEEDVQGARERLVVKGRPAMAIYPGTTSFYECMVMSAPYRASEMGGEQYQQFHDQVVVQVEFLDDEDPETKQTPRRIIPSVCVFAKPTSKRRRE